MHDTVAVRTEQSKSGETDHWQLCQLTAEKFDLWERSDGDETFPVWLSRVVEGEMRDAGIE